ncbi:MAG: bifunctional UDP-N-acetylglucosamine diphosphorylase/glucosamine-1-phosphate N-acetyltransferase GlmU, partial [Candidatus Puniceispirillum sp.]
MDVAALILAAGKGTRLNSSLPKPLHRIGGRPMLAWSLDAARAAGACRIVTILGTSAEMVEAWLDGGESCIQDPPNGTGHAVLAAQPTLHDFTGIVLVMFADTPLVTAATLTDLSAAIRDGADIAVLGFTAADPTGYGRLVTDADGGLVKIVEETDATAAERGITLVNGGVMAARAELLFDLLAKTTPDNSKGEIYLTDIVEQASHANHKVVYRLTGEDEIAGVNDRQDLAFIESVVQTRLRAQAMQHGVTMQAPETVFLSADVTFGRDVILEPHVVITGGATIGEGTVIRAFTHIDGAVLGPCCMVGPFARLRPGTILQDGVKIGNFVETKNAEMGAGSKANHLTYLGDTTVGQDANVGAGTITCNYDGFGKFRTLIGDGASIGSNT